MIGVKLAFAKGMVLQKNKILPTHKNALVGCPIIVFYLQ
jgi:hypothetical protein